MTMATSEDDTMIYQQLTSKYLKQACLVTRETIFITGNVCRRLGVPEDPDALAELDQLTQEAAKDGVSVIAIDTSTDRVVGVSINKFLLKSQPFFQQFYSTFKNPKARAIIDLITETDNLCDIFEHCGLNCVMEILFLGTLPEYRKKGIAKKLCEVSLAIAQDLRDGRNVKKSVDGKSIGLEPVPEAAYGIFTSFISQKIARNLGFEIAVEKNLRKLEVGGQVVDNRDVETPSVLVKYKLLHKRDLVVI